MGRHLGQIALKVIANIFEIAIQSVVFQENRVVCNVARTDHFNHFRPDGVVVLPIGRLAASLDPNCHSVSLHPRNRQWRVVPLANVAVEASLEY